MPNLGAIGGIGKIINSDWLMKKILSIMMFLFFMIGMQAQDLRIHVNKKGKVGFVDASGNEVIKCQYESAYPFTDGVSIVTKSGKYGLINTDGKVVLPLKYTSITSWNDKLYLIKDGKKMGLANHAGTIVLKPQYSLITKTNCYGKALIALGGKSSSNENKTYMANAKYGIIDPYGDIIIKPIYKGLYEFTYDGKDKYPFYEGKRLEYSYHYTTDTLVTDCTYLGFSKNGFNIFDAGLINGSGEELLKQGLFDYIMMPKSNMVRYYITKKKETICGYYNLDTEKSFQVATFEQAIGDMNYWSHGDFIGDIAPVNGDSWSIIDKSGKAVREGYQKLIHNEATDLWAALKQSGKWDVFDDSNKDIGILSGYDEIRFPANKEDKQIFAIKKGSSWGAVSRSGEIAVPFVYDDMHGNVCDVLVVNKDKRWGVVSLDNKSIIKCEYANLILPSEKNTTQYWVMKSDSLFYHLNLNSNKLSDKGYKYVTNFKDGIAHVAPLNIKIDDTKLNKAQLFSPHASLKSLEEADLSKSQQAFGYLISEDDAFLCDIPVSSLYVSKVVEAIKKKGGKALTGFEARNVLLNATTENRSYNITQLLSEDEWNY